MALKQYINSILEKESLTDADIKKHVKNIRLYDELAHCRSIKSLLGREEACIILIPTNGTFDGHWSLLFRNGKGMLEYFDSYGKVPDHWIFKKKTATHPYPYLTELILASKEKCVYNHHAFQQSGSSIATCGRWCLLRYKFRNMTLDNFIRCFGKKITLTPDEICCLLV